MACPKLSIADKTYIQQQRDQPHVNAVLADDSPELLADVYGYEDQDVDHLQQEDQVSQQQSINTMPEYAGQARTKSSPCSCNAQWIINSRKLRIAQEHMCQVESVH